jgi:hypothetical protein
MFSMLNDAWKANVKITPLPEIRWQSRTYHTPPEPTKPFARAVIMHASGGQVSLAGPGGTKWSRRGVCIVECLSPIKDGGGLSTALVLAEVARNAFEGQSTQELWFRNCRINEIGEAEDWFQINVVAEFYYEEVK